MAKNCIAVYDEMLGVKYSKKKSKFKIDGVIAMLMGLLLCIEENGIEKFLQREKVRWTCSDCGGCISVHDGVCYGCGKNYTDRKH